MCGLADEGPLQCLRTRMWQRNWKIHTDYKVHQWLMVHTLTDRHIWPLHVWTPSITYLFHLTMMLKGYVACAHRLFFSNTLLTPIRFLTLLLLGWTVGPFKPDEPYNLLSVFFSTQGCPTSLKCPQNFQWKVEIPQWGISKVFVRHKKHWCCSVLSVFVRPSTKPWPPPHLYFCWNLCHNT